MFIFKVILISIIIFAYIYISSIYIYSRCFFQVTGNKWNAKSSRRTIDILFSHECIICIIQFVPVALIVKMIMGFSSDNGTASRMLSRPVAYFFTKVMAFFGSSNSNAIENVTNVEDLLTLKSLYLDMIERITRKFAHVFEYALLAFVIWVLIYSRSKLPVIYSYLLGIIGVLIIGSIDEYNQSSIDGRWGSPIDVCVDLAGALLAVLFIRLLLLILSRIISRKNPKS